MLRFTLLLLLIVPSIAVGQIPGAVQIGQSFTKSEIDKAKTVIDSIKPSIFSWEVGQFEVFQKGEKAQGELYWDVSDETIVTVTEIPANTLFWYKGIRADSKLSKRWEFPPQASSYWVFEGVREGTTKITVLGFDPTTKKIVQVAKMTITVGNPQPDPGPSPGPGPTPGPVPIPGQGLRVLIVYESADLPKMPSAQVQMLTAKEVLDYLDAKTAKVNGQPEYRKFDQNADVKGESQTWQDAMARPRASVPWIVISNGTTGYEGALPANKNDLMTLLRKYGGQ